MRNYILERILSECPKGRRPCLQVIIDLTTNALFSLLNPSKLARLLGGEDADGRAKVGLKLPSTVLACTAQGQGTLLGVYRWLVLSLIAYILAHWAYLSTQLPDLPDWGEAAKTALEFIFPQILVSLLLLDIAHLIPLARSYGFDIHISRCKI